MPTPGLDFFILDNLISIVFIFILLIQSQPHLLIKAKYHAHLGMITGLIGVILTQERGRIKWLAIFWLFSSLLSFVISFKSAKKIREQRFKEQKLKNQL